MRETHLRYLLAVALIGGAVFGLHLAISEQAEPSPVEESAATTPTETATATPDPPEQLAPGLTEEGVADAVALAEAHTDQLRNTSYTVVTTQTIWNGNRSVYWRADAHARVSSGGSPVGFARNTSGRPPGPSTLQGDFAIWHNDTHSFSRWVDPNGTVSYRRNAPEEDLLQGTPGRGPFVRGLFAGVNTTVVERIERNGTTLYRVVSTSQPDWAPVSERQRSNYSLSALVDSSGLVHRHQISYDVRVDGETHHATRTWRLSDVGSTTVEKPDWFEEAQNATAEQD